MLLAALGALAVPARGARVKVLKDGRPFGEAEVLGAGGAPFLGARDAARLYGGSVRWLPATGALELSVRGQSVRLRAGSRDALLGGARVRLDGAVRMEGTQAYVPLSFFSGEAFSAAARLATRLEPQGGPLRLARLGEVGTPRCSVEGGRARIVLDARKPLSAEASLEGSTLSVRLPRARPDWPARGDFAEGPAASWELGSRKGAARLAVLLRSPARWEVKSLRRPDRVVLDIWEEKGAAREEKASDGSGKERREGNLVKPDRTAASDDPKAALKRRFRVVVDPGHGGKDGGASGRRGTLEKDVNLRVAKALAGRLEEDDAFEVRLTRRDDTFIPLSKRAEIANTWEADLFVSLHCNAHPGRSESGYEVYFLSETASDPEAERLAEFENSVLALEGQGGEEAADILYALARTEFINDAAELAGRVTQALSRKAGLPNRGVKQASFYVLRGAAAPAILVEMAFLTHPQDEALLREGRFREKMADGIYRGILAFARDKVRLGARR